MFPEFLYEPDKIYANLKICAIATEWLKQRKLFKTCVVSKIISDKAETLIWEHKVIIDLFCQNLIKLADKPKCKKYRTNSIYGHIAQVSLEICTLEC